MIRSNPPLPLEISADPNRSQREWDLGYWQRARKNGNFLACKVMAMELFNPPVLSESKLQEIFNRVPGTQNPPSISSIQFSKLLEILEGLANAHDD